MIEIFKRHAHLVSLEDTAEPFGDASVNCQLAVALYIRALASVDADLRETRLAQLRELHLGF